MRTRFAQPYDCDETRQLASLATYLFVANKLLDDEWVNSHGPQIPMRRATAKVLTGFRVKSIQSMMATLKDSACANPGAPRLRILIVDDDPDVTEIAAHALQHLNVDCQIAACGTEAVEIIGRSPPDGVILDVNMADVDGFTVLMLLRRNPNTRNLPVLLLTARHEESDIARGFGYGANDYMAKPFLPFELALRVEKMLAESVQTQS